MFFYRWYKDVSAENGCHLVRKRVPQQTDMTYVFFVWNGKMKVNKSINNKKHGSALIIQRTTYSRLFHKGLFSIGVIAHVRDDHTFHQLLQVKYSSIIWLDFKWNEFYASISPSLPCTAHKQFTSTEHSMLHTGCQSREVYI